MNNNNISNNQTIYDVIVVGGGISGLYVASQLIVSSVCALKVLLLEATDRLGGRCKQIDTLVDWPVEVGGEFIHGIDTTTHHLIEEQQFPLIRVFDKPNSFAVYQSRISSLRYIEDIIKSGTSNNSNSNEDLYHLNRELARLFKIMNEIYCGALDQPNIPSYVKSLQDYLIWQKMSPELLSIADSLLGKVFGTSIDSLGIDLLRLELRKPNAMSSPTPTFRLQNSTRQIINHLSKKLQNNNSNYNNIKFNQSVNNISVINNNLLKITTNDGSNYISKRVVVTIPINRVRELKFQPEPPANWVKAVNSIPMGKAMKVFVRFSKPVWPLNLQVMACADCIVSQMWFDGPQLRSNVGSDQYLACGFIGGELVDSMNDLRERYNRTIISEFLSLLDRIFETDRSNHYYVSHHIEEWQSAYSYPPVLSNELNSNNFNPFEIISNTVLNDRIYFAGEAIAFKYESSSINGAVESGKIIKDKILRDIKESSM